MSLFSSIHHFNISLNSFSSSTPTLSTILGVPCPKGITIILAFSFLFQNWVKLFSTNLGMHHTISMGCKEVSKKKPNKQTKQPHHGGGENCSPIRGQKKSSLSLEQILFWNFQEKKNLLMKETTKKFCTCQGAKKKKKKNHPYPNFLPPLKSNDASPTWSWKQ